MPYTLSRVVMITIKRKHLWRFVALFGLAVLTGSALLANAYLSSGPEDNTQTGWWPQSSSPVSIQGDSLSQEYGREEDTFAWGQPLPDRDTFEETTQKQTEAEQSSGLPAARNEEERPQPRELPRLPFEIFPQRAGQQPEFAPGELLVRFKFGVSSQQQLDVHASFGTTLLEQSAQLNISRISLPEGASVAAFVQRYTAHPLVEFAQPNYIYSTSLVPADAQ